VAVPKWTEVVAAHSGKYIVIKQFRNFPFWNSGCIACGAHVSSILGNAELLLAEVRRGNDGRLPPGGLQRLETIAALAVRLRETIRRLSQQWEVRDAALRKKTDM